MSWKFYLRAAGLVVATSPLMMSAASVINAGERPTMYDTCDPRPDILYRPFYYNHAEYRRAYNRPTYLGGKLMQLIEPTSLEAMSWCENLREGRYAEKHMPPAYKRYYAPKPWEVLNTGSRPDFPRDNAGSPRQPAAAPAPTATESEQSENVVQEAVPVPAPTNSAEGGFPEL